MYNVFKRDVRREVYCFQRKMVRLQPTCQSLSLHGSSMDLADFHTDVDRISSVDEVIEGASEECAPVIALTPISSSCFCC